MNETIADVSWVLKAGDAVRLARNADEARKQAGFLNDAKTDFERVLARMKDISECVIEVSAYGWEGPRPSPSLMQNLRVALQTLDSRPLTMVQRELDEFSHDVASSLNAHWRSYVAEQLGSVDELLSLARTLEGVEGVANVSEELVVALGALRRSESSLPTRKSVEMLNTAKDLLRRLESSLQPIEVRRFLSAVVRGGASVDNLTPDVTKWLSNHGALNRFRVVAGSPVGSQDE